jgi:hypothetical protein
MNLRDLPQPVPDVFIRAMQARLLDALRGEALNRRVAVHEGRQTPEVAACLLDQFSQGVLTLSDVIGIPIDLRTTLDHLLRELDPDFDAHRMQRWQTRELAFTSLRQER